MTITAAQLDAYAALMLDLSEALREKRPYPMSSFAVKEHMAAIEAAGDPLNVVAKLREAFANN